MKCAEREEERKANLQNYMFIFDDNVLNRRVICRELEKKERKIVRGRISFCKFAKLCMRVSMCMHSE